MAAITQRWHDKCSHPYLKGNLEAWRTRNVIESESKTVHSADRKEVEGSGSKPSILLKHQSGMALIVALLMMLAVTWGALYLS